MQKSVKHPATTKHRSAIKLSPEKKNAAKAKRIRARFLKQLAGEVMGIIHFYHPGLSKGTFYFNLLLRFRKEPLTNRFFLLRQLNGFSIYPGFLFNESTICKVRSEGLKNKIRVNLDVISHTDSPSDKANYYYYKVILLTWPKDGKPATHSSQLSEWIGVNGPLHEFEFIFPVASHTMYWLVCVKKCRAISIDEPKAEPVQAMYIAEAGSFDKRDENILKIREEVKKHLEKRSADNGPRVKPKRNKKQGNEKQRNKE